MTQVLTQANQQETTEYPYICQALQEFINNKQEYLELQELQQDLTCDSPNHILVYTRISYEMGDYYASNYDSLITYKTRPACVLH